MSMILVWGISFGIFTIGRTRINLRWAVRWALLAAFGGMWAYIYLSLGMMGIKNILDFLGLKGIIMAILLGTGTGWLTGWLWYRNTLQRSRKR